MRAPLLPLAAMLTAVAAASGVRGAETQVAPTSDELLLERELAGIRAEIERLRTGDDGASPSTGNS